MFSAFNLVCIRHKSCISANVINISKKNKKAIRKKKIIRHQTSQLFQIHASNFTILQWLSYLSKRSTSIISKVAKDIIIAEAKQHTRDGINCYILEKTICLITSLRTYYLAANSLFFIILLCLLSTTFSKAPLHFLPRLNTYGTGDKDDVSTLLLAITSDDI